MKRFAFAVILAMAGSAAAATSILRDVHGVDLRLKGSVAQVTHDGKRLSVRGAINARRPRHDIPQVKFKLDYSGRKGSGARFCGRYDGPKLVLFVRGCRARDGSYWALQDWRRLVPNYGGVTARRELHVAHWTGTIAGIEDIKWSMRYGAPYLCGRLTYRGHGVYGFRASRLGVPLDGYGRLVFLDTYNSALGRGWHRENSFLAQAPDGRWCYSFSGRAVRALGERFRVTASGPGVTPIIRTIVAPRRPLR